MPTDGAGDGGHLQTAQLPPLQGPAIVSITA